MSQFSATRRMPFPALGVYGIIADVDAYCEFLPLCEDARTWDRQIERGALETFKAELLIVYPRMRLRERFASNVKCNAEAFTVQSISNRPPVKHVETRWRVIPVGESSCDVHFFIDYQMSSKLLHLALNSAFDYAMRRIMAAFEDRARKLLTVTQQF